LGTLVRITYSPSSAASYEEAHRAFYLALTAGANSPRAAYIQGALYDQARCYRLLLQHDQPDPTIALERYRTLMQLVLTSQIDAAIAKLHQDLAVWRDGLNQRAGWQLPPIVDALAERIGG
jgi:DNA-binding GntR family transcriptional regulator